MEAVAHVKNESYYVKSMDAATDLEPRSQTSYTSTTLLWTVSHGTQTGVFKVLQNNADR